jgi:hypothetical protein
MCQSFWFPHVPHTSPLDIGEDGAKPLSVDATLECKVFDEWSGGFHRAGFFMYSSH